MSDRARQQNVNFLMCDLVTGLPAFILLLGLFCRGKGGEGLVAWTKPRAAVDRAFVLPCRRQGTPPSARSATRTACDPRGTWL